MKTVRISNKKFRNRKICLVLKAIIKGRHCNVLVVYRQQTVMFTINSIVLRKDFLIGCLIFGQFDGFFCLCADRETLIKRAQQERQKRAEIRKQNTGAVIIQSCARSFLARTKCKERERCAFDNYLETSGLSNREQLEYLLKRILFFYYKKNQKDGERLVSDAFRL